PATPAAAAADTVVDQAPAAPAADPAPTEEPATPDTGTGTDTGTGADTGAGTDTPAVPAPSKLPPVKHVWLISLTGQRYEEAWGPKAVEPYLATQLRAQGTLLPRSFAVAHGSVANGVALLSGQGPNPATQADCTTASPVQPGTIDASDDLGQAKGTGCIYPATVSTLPDQLTGAGLTWKAYVQSIASPDPAQPQTCRHPEAGAPDPFGAPRPGDPYLTARNPFVFFATIVGDPVCGSNVVGLDRLAPDLATRDDTPAFSYIVPDACHDGRATPCAEGAPAGLAATAPWLKGVVDQITATDAYKDSGLIVITFDQAPADGPLADSRACRCVDQTAPFWSNTPDAGSAAAPGKGGGRVGTLLLSPFVTAGGTVRQDYDHISLLKSIEDLFGLAHLGAAADPAHKPLGPKAYAEYTPPGR
ncbi:MAG: phosphoesterase, partial [Solirubrobacterales bacterium]|nr:phosphoesterase [Solirubrobacterales bacterium]